MAELTSSNTYSPPECIFGKAGTKSCKSEFADSSAGISPLCPQCQSKKVWRDGLRQLAVGDPVQRWLCRECSYRFSDPNDVERAKKEFQCVESIDTKKLKVPSNILVSRQICVIHKEAKNLVPQTEIKTVAGEESLDAKGKLLQYEFYLQKEGTAPSTTKQFGTTMRGLAKISNIADPESVKEALAYLKIKESTKSTYCAVYESFLRFIGKTWKRPKYQCSQKLPEFIPTEEEIDQLIAGSGKKIATILQIMKETGMRLGECLSLTWTCIDPNRDIITLTVAEKHSLPRIFKVSHALINMCEHLPKKNEKVFGTMSTISATTGLQQTRARVATKLVNPRIAKIHYHLIRHWFGTMEYHKTHDIDYVRRRLGHRSVLNTQIYINIEQAIFTSTYDEYIVKTAETIEEACKLIEVGFEYVTDMNHLKLFKKRK